MASARWIARDARRLFGRAVQPVGRRGARAVRQGRLARQAARRRGYVGVQALAGESAEFELSASLYMPQAGGGDACTRYTAACAADSSRGAYLGGAPATPPALVEDNSMAATMVRRGVPAVAALVGLCLIIVFIRRLLIKRGGRTEGRCACREVSRDRIELFAT